MWTHKHHVIPRHEWKKRFGNLKGFNDADNIVYLSIEQHAEVHKWLWEQFNSELDRIAWLGLSGRIPKEEIIRLKRLTQSPPVPKGSRMPDSWKHNISKAQINMKLGVNSCP